MTDYRVTCTTQAPLGAHHSQAHIVAVGTGPALGQVTQRWSLDQVLAALDRGDRFYTVSPSTGRYARVERFWCSHCGREFIRSSADAVTDNNLDNLPRC